MNNLPTKHAQSAPRSMALRLPNWRGLSNRLMHRLTQDSTEMDALRDDNLRLMAENAALIEWSRKAYATLMELYPYLHDDEIAAMLETPSNALSKNVIDSAPVSVKGGSDPLIYAVESTGANE